MSERRPKRAFLGIALEESVRHLLAAHLAAEFPSGLPGKPVPPGNWHLTLRFLGATSDARLERVVHTIAEAQLPSAFAIRFGGLGTFPRTARATVLWLGVESGAGTLAGVARICEDAAVGAGLPPEDRPFHPHLTLARLRPPQDLRSVRGSFQAFDVETRVTEITLFESHLSPEGARYEARERMDLGA